MSDEGRARVLEALRKMEGDYSAFPVLESCHCADCAAMRERRQAVSQAVTIIEREAAARAEGEAAGRAAEREECARTLEWMASHPHQQADVANALKTGAGLLRIRAEAEARARAAGGGQ